MVCKQCQKKPVSRRDPDATKTGLCDECLELPFPITSVCRLALVGKFAPRDIGRLDDADLSRLADQMAEAYTDAVFWLALEVIPEDTLQAKSLT